MEEWKVHVLKGQVNDQDILDEVQTGEGIIYTIWYNERQNQKANHEAK